MLKSPVPARETRRALRKDFRWSIGIRSSLRLTCDGNSFRYGTPRTVESLEIGCQMDRAVEHSRERGIERTPLRSRSPTSTLGQVGWPEFPMTQELPAPSAISEGLAWPAWPLQVTRYLYGEGLQRLIDDRR